MQFLKYIMLSMMLLGSPLQSTSQADNSKLIIPSPVLEHFKLSVQPSISYPGDALIAKTPEGGYVEFLGEKYKLKPSKQGYITFLPVPINQPHGELTLKWYPDQKENTSNITYAEKNTIAKVSIKDKKFPTQYLTVTKEQENMQYDRDRINKDNKKIWAAFEHPIPEPLFSGTFLEPLNGIVTTHFGNKRYTNGKLDSRHLAIDIAAPKGTPIPSPNNGKVVLADHLYLQGNRVIIDHGSNLFSSYSHLTEMNVKVGDIVGKGDIIGWVGTTGFSTGPHLHFAMYVYGYPVNPELFYDTDPLHW